MLFGLALTLTVLQQPAPAQQTPWRAGSGYTLVAASGLATEPSGAVLALRADSTSSSPFGTVSAAIPADAYRGRRVSVQADIEARAVTGGASPWLRADGPSGMLGLDNGTDQAVRGTTTAHRVVTLFVPPDATQLVFGLLLSGKGESYARSLRLVAGPPVDPTAPVAAAAKLVLDSAFAVVRTRALWRDTVTWAAVEPRVRAVATGAQTPSDVYPAIRLLLTSLGDHHSFFLRPSGAQQFRTGGADNPRPNVKLLPPNVGYVSIPAYSGIEPTAARAYAKALQDSLAVIAPGAACRWVVDLRGNGGGNMWPMLGGLRPFLGDVGLGSFVTNGGSGPLWHANAVDVPPPASLASLESSYVAVLYGPRTASSGEAVAISFRGRPHTRSFGLATAGLSSANGTFSLPDSSIIVLTVSVEADRTGQRYGDKLLPDEEIGAAPIASGDDPQLARAVAWLQSQRCGP